MCLSSDFALGRYDNRQGKRWKEIPEHRHVIAALTKLFPVPPRNNQNAETQALQREVDELRRHVLDARDSKVRSVANVEPTGAEARTHLKGGLCAYTRPHHAQQPLIEGTRDEGSSREKGESGQTKKTFIGASRHRLPCIHLRPLSRDVFLNLIYARPLVDGSCNRAPGLGQTAHTGTKQRPRSLRQGLEKSGTGGDEPLGDCADSKSNPLPLDTRLPRSLQRKSQSSILCANCTFGVYRLGGGLLHVHLSHVLFRDQYSKPLREYKKR